MFWLEPWASNNVLSMRFERLFQIAENKIILWLIRVLGVMEHGCGIYLGEDLCLSGRRIS